MNTLRISAPFAYSGVTASFLQVLLLASSRVLRPLCLSLSYLHMRLITREPATRQIQIYRRTLTYSQPICLYPRVKIRDIYRSRLLTCLLHLDWLYNWCYTARIAYSRHYLWVISRCCYRSIAADIHGPRKMRTRSLCAMLRTASEYILEITDSTYHTFLRLLFSCVLSHSLLSQCRLARYR